MATVKIIEQPAKIIRFRYEREGRAGGLVLGASSTQDNKIFTKIQIEGYQGRALVIVSCVTKDEPYRPHPNKLVGKDGCRKGVCSVEVSPETMSVEFTSLGIHCMRRRDVEDSLKLRKDIRVDPFRTGFANYKRSTSFDLNILRLCFQVFLLDENGDFTIPLTPVVSEPIYDKRVVSHPMIVKMSKCVCPVNGGKEEIILVCDKVLKNDIQIRFYEEKDGQLVWEGFGIFQPSDVHKNVVIWFRPPPYKSLTVTEPVKVLIQLQRPSDGETSDSLPFEYLPLESEPGMLNRMRQKPLHLQRNFSDPPSTKQEQSATNLFPQSANSCVNTMNFRFPNLIASPQQYSIAPIPMNIMGMGTTPLVPSVGNFQFPNLELDESSCSSSTQHVIGGRISDSVHTTPNLPSSPQAEYIFSSISPSTNSKSNFSFISMEQTTEDDDSKPTTIAEMENNLIRNSSSEMDVQTINDLSRLLIDGYTQQSELQLLNLDSGELDTMNISS